MKQDKTKFVKTALIFILLFSLPLSVEIFSPFAHNNFRIWEAVATQNFNHDRPFYVDRTIHGIDVGDLGFQTKYTIKKNVTVETDQFGYRNSNALKKYDIVVVGGSNIVGPGLTQTDTFVEKLMVNSQLSAYSFAPKTINDFIAEKRFAESPPKIVIFAAIERHIYSKPKLEYSTTFNKRNTFLFIEKTGDFVDYVSKLSFYRSRFSKLRGYYFPKNVIVNEETNMLFYQDSLNSRQLNLERYNNTIETLQQYDEYFSEKGIQFFFMPIPDKETIYSADLPKTHEKYQPYTGYLPTLISELEQKGVTVIDLYGPFSNEDEFVFQLDDTHWNSLGVMVAVNETLKVIYSEN